jgi:hypothetical protein
MVKERTHRKLVTQFLVSDFIDADCCLATSNNIRNSVVVCVYSVVRCLSVRYLAIHVTILKWILNKQIDNHVDRVYVV